MNDGKMFIIWVDGITKEMVHQESFSQVSSLVHKSL